MGFIRGGLVVPLLKYKPEIKSCVWMFMSDAKAVEKVEVSAKMKKVMVIIER